MDTRECPGRSQSTALREGPPRPALRRSISLRSSRFLNQVEPRCRGNIEAYSTSRSAFVSHVTEE